MRKFEKVTFEEYGKYKNMFNYEDIIIPTRQTTNACGYDFTSPHEVVINQGEVGLIYTGIKACMNDDEFLMIAIRSSKGRKEGLVLANQLGIIDSDYYGNIDNDGHIIVAIRNLSNEKRIIKKGERVCQGIFLNYLKASDEEKINKKRVGGYGSTDN